MTVNSISNMKAKLIKEANFYALKNGNKIISTSDFQLNMLLNYPFILSLKTCQAIERGYDLDELAENCADQYADRFDYADGHGNREVYSNRDEVEKVYTIGFQKALELMGDKKYSEEDMNKAFRSGHSLQTEIALKKKEYKPSGHFFEELIQSLQQTEWDVEIEMRSKNIDELRESNEGFLNNPNLYIPKLDSEGCLILKKI
jgi:hypothetical protein